MEEKLQGVVDRLIYGCLTGWVRNNDSDSHITLAISINDTEIIETITDRLQADLSETEARDGCFGYVLPLPPALFHATRETTLHVHFKQNGKELKGSPLRISASATTGQMEEIRNGYVYGWIAPQLPLPCSLAVELLIDGQPRGIFSPTIVNTKLEKYGLGKIPTGLHIKLPEDLLADREHTIALRAVSDSQLLRNSPRQFKTAPIDGTPLLETFANNVDEKRQVMTILATSARTSLQYNISESLINIETAKKLRHHGNKRAALALLRAIFSGNRIHTNRTNAIQVADELLHWNEINDAEAIYQQILTINPDNQWARFGISNILRRRGDILGALRLTKALIIEFPTQPKFQMAAAVDHEVLGHPLKAIALLDNLIEQHPSHNGAVAYKLQLLDKQGDKSALQNLLPDAIARYPDNLRIQIRNIIFRRERGAELWALHAFQELAIKFNSAAQPILQAGLTAKALGLHESALNFFTKAVAIDKSSNILALIVMAQIKLGRLEEARMSLGIHIEEKNEPASDLPWLRILLSATQGDRLTATLHYQQLLLDTHDSDQLLRLVQHGRQYTFSREAELVLRQSRHVDSSDWEIMALRINLLIELGELRAARTLLETSYTSQLTLCQQVECSALWLSLGYPCRARIMLNPPLEQMLHSCPPTNDELNEALRIAHLFGEYRLRDAIYTKYASNVTPNTTAQNLKYAWRLCQDGKRDASDKLLYQTASVNNDLALTRWQARFAQQNNDINAAISALEKTVHEPIVSLEEATLWLRTLIAAEDIGKAQQELGRLSRLFAEEDMAPLHAELLNLDFCFEESNDHLRRMVRQFPFSEEISLNLASQLLDNNEFSESKQIIDLWRTRRPASMEWGSLSLTWYKSTEQNWDSWQTAHREMKHQLDYGQRLRLMFIFMHSLMHMREHDRAERMLRVFTHKLQSLPMTHSTRTGYNLTCANLWASLKRPDESYSLLSKIEQKGLPSGLKESFLKVSSFNESFGNREANRVVALRNQLHHTRHHLILTPFYKDRAIGIPTIRIAVLLHLYYTDIWQEIKQYLYSLAGTDFHLYVTISCTQLDATIVEELQAIDPNVRIISTENRGFDVGAHWQSLDRINLSEYDVALLLQTKKSTHVKVGPLWRHNLMRSLLGSQNRWRENLYEFQNNPKVGMIGSALHHHSMDPWHYKEMRDVLMALNIPTQFDKIKNYYQYVGGTIFLIRANILQELYTKTRPCITFPRYEDLSISKRMDKSLAHAMERAFGIFTRWRGYDILWRE